MRFRVDLGAEGHSVAGWIEITHPSLLERLQHSAIVPALVKRNPDSEYELDHFDLVPRTDVETRSLEELESTRGAST